MIAIIFGGKSSEHTISVATGVQAFDALRGKEDILPVFVDRNGVWRAGRVNVRPTLAKLKKGKIVRVKMGERAFFVGMKRYYISCALICMHGMNGEDGTVQGACRAIGIPFSGCDVAPSAICMDKERTKQVLSACEIPQIAYTSVAKRDWVEDKEGRIEQISKLSFPLIIKPARCGSSIGISIAKTENELKSAMDEAFEYDRKVVVECALSSFREVNCAVLKRGEEYYVSDVEEPSKKGEILAYKDKYLFGAKSSVHVIPAPVGAKLTAKVRSLALAAYKALECSGVVRIDFLISEEGKVYLNELNSIPGSLSTYLFPTLGFSATDICSMLIDDGIYEFDKREAIKYSFENELYASK